MRGVEKLAREAGMFFAKDHFGDVPEIETNLEQLAKFAELVIAGTPTYAEMAEFAKDVLSVYPLPDAEPKASEQRAERK
jgi:hypothetical protein